MQIALMLREGWIPAKIPKYVCLNPFTATSRITPAPSKYGHFVFSAISLPLHKQLLQKRLLTGSAMYGEVI